MNSSDQRNTQSLTTYFAHAAFVFCFPDCGGICQDNMHDLNLILCAAYVDPRYFAEHTEYLYRATMAMMMQCGRAAGLELIWQLA